jgi:tRNA(Ile)-lysidine synthase
MAFPQAESALAAAAAQAQAAASLAAEVLAQDLPLLLDPAGGLHLAQWLALPPARRRNALQGWLRQALGRGAPEALLMRLGDELPGRRAATWDAPGHILRRYRGVLRAVGLAPPAGPLSTPSAGTPAASTPPPVASSAVLDLSRPGLHPMPDWSGSWLIERVNTAGLAPSLLQSARAAPRSGGERFSLARGAMPRSLKKQFQARGIPAWQRGGPLLFSADGRLMWVPGLGADVRVQAIAGDPQLRVTWVPDLANSTGLRQPAG